MKKNNQNKLSSIKRIILPVLKKNDVVKAGLFGSVARGDAKADSDIDILIKFKGRKSLLDLVGLKLELEEELNKKVDVLTYKSLHPLIREGVLREEIKIL